MQPEPTYMKRVTDEKEHINNFINYYLIFNNEIAAIRQLDLNYSERIQLYIAYLNERKDTP